MALTFIHRVHAQRVLSMLARVLLASEQTEQTVNECPRLTLALLRAVHDAVAGGEFTAGSKSWESDTLETIRALELELTAPDTQRGTPAARSRHGRESPRTGRLNPQRGHQAMSYKYSELHDCDATKCEQSAQPCVCRHSRAEHHSNPADIFDSACTVCRCPWFAVPNQDHGSEDWSDKT